MDKYCAAPAGNAGARVLVYFDNEVIEMIVTPEPVAELTACHLDCPIVAAVLWVFAPSVHRSNWAGRKPR
jgi:hypothetical protein